MALGIVYFGLCFVRCCHFPTEEMMNHFMIEYKVTDELVRDPFVFRAIQKTAGLHKSSVIIFNMEEILYYELHYKTRTKQH